MATIKFYFDNFPQSSEAQISFSVKGDIANEAAIVSTDYEGAFTFQRLLGQAFASDVKEAEAKIAEETKERLDGLERNWAKENPAANQNAINSMNKEYPSERFTSDQRATIFRSYILYDLCKYNEGSDRSEICRRSSENYSKMNQFVCKTDTYPSLNYQCGSEPPQLPVSNESAINLPPCTPTTPDEQECNMLP